MKLTLHFKWNDSKGNLNVETENEHTIKYPILPNTDKNK